jgi:hypothetical protein
VLPGTTFLLEGLRRHRSPWLDGLHRREQDALASFRAAGPTGMVEELMKYYRGDLTLLAKYKLAHTDLRAFYTHVTEPDLGLFRTNALSEALLSLTGEARAPDDAELERDTRYTFQWLAAIARRCDEAGATTTFVIIPHPFDVDERLREEWAPLADVRALTAYVRRTAEILRGLLAGAGLRFVDLYPVLAGTRGAYLDMDLHWSPKGHELVVPAVKAAVAARTAH